MKPEQEEKVLKILQAHKYDILSNEKPHISYSELSTWVKCSWNHKLQHIDKIVIEIPLIHAIFGSAIHEAGEHFLRTRELKIQIALDYIDLNWEESKKIINNLEELSQDKKNELLLLFCDDDTVHVNSKGKKSVIQGKKTWKKQAINILNDIPKFLDESFPDWEYVDAEHLLYEDLNPLINYNHIFKGFVDGIIKCNAKRGKKKIYYIIDWKTSTSGWFREKKSDNLTLAQIILYKYFWCKKNNIELNDARCAYIILKRKAKPGSICDLFPVSAGPKSIEKALKHIRNMLHCLNKNIALKNKYSCKYCDFVGTTHCDAIYRIIKNY